MGFEHLFRPLFTKWFPPSQVVKTYSTQRTPFLNSLAKVSLPEVPPPSRPVELWGLNFRNDVGNAAGFDKDGKLLDFNYGLGAGYTVVGTVLHRTHTGNLFTVGGKTFNPWAPLPHSQSAINSLGLPGHGIDPVIDRIKSFQDRVQPRDYPIGLSVMGHPAQQGQAKIDGVVECLEKALPHVDFIEINESCPNVSNHDPAQFSNRIQSFRSCRDQVAPGKPLLVKFGTIPAQETLVELDRSDIQGVVLLNTQNDYDKMRGRLESGDRRLFDYFTRNYRGGVSGKAMAEDSMEAVSHARLVIDNNHLKLSVVHVGGLFNREDMEGSRMMAPLRQWYTGLMDSVSIHGFKGAYPSIF